MPEQQIDVAAAELVGDEPIGDGTWRIRRYRVDLPPETAKQVQAAMPGAATREHAGR